MSELARCIDAAFPPATAPDGIRAVLGYIGGHRLDRDTHIWTLEQWQPFGQLRQFPCWVCDPSKDPVASAQAAAEAAWELGWAHGRAIVGDMEAIESPVWWAKFQAELERRDWWPVIYESAGIIGKNKAARIWAALWDDKPVLQDNWVAKQYLSLPRVDRSVVGEELMSHGGIGRRHLRVH